MPHPRRNFLKAAGTAAGTALLLPPGLLSQSAMTGENGASLPSEAAADYTLVIAIEPIELAPNRTISVTTYNGQFPGPLLRLKEGGRVTINIRDETDTPEQLHWHGQFLSTDVDGAAEEGTPFIPPHGSRRISFVPRPSDFRSYHTHVRAARTCRRANTAGWSDRFTSNRSSTPEIMTAWCSLR
jgi:FtsP/CotA-like multicopper oxidase with cupredoxin domain